MAVVSWSLTSSLPLGTRILTGALVGLSTILFLLRLFLTQDGIHLGFQQTDSALAFPALVIVPGQSWFYPWTLLVAGFCETSFIEFLISLASIPLAARYLERVWGAKELLKFTVIVVVLSNVIAWGLAIILFVVLRADVLIYGTQYHGLEALQVGFLVAMTQLIPEHQVQLFGGRAKLRVKDLPMLYVTFSNIACVLGYTSPFILIQFGWLISWAYLRFFKAPEVPGAPRGDRSEAFALVHWFPPFMHPVVSRIGNLVHDICAKLHIIQPSSSYAYSGISSNPGGGAVEFDLESYAAGAGNAGGSGGGAGGSGAAGGSASGGARAEAERRRAMALKALDQKLAGSGAPSRSNSNNAAADASTSNGSAATAAGATAAAAAKPKPAAEAKPSTPAAAVPAAVVPAPADEEVDAADWGSDSEDGDIGGAASKSKSKEASSAS